MTTTLAQVRGDLYDALTAIDDVEVYRHLQDDYHYPAIIVGWPQAMDVRADMGGLRDFLIDVNVVCEVTDPESSDDLLSELLEATVEVLLAGPAVDVRPVTDFRQQQTADDRTVIWCRLPVAVLG